MSVQLRIDLDDICILGFQYKKLILNIFYISGLQSDHIDVARIFVQVNHMDVKCLTFLPRRLY